MLAEYQPAPGTDPDHRRDPARWLDFALDRVDLVQRYTYGAGDGGYGEGQGYWRYAGQNVVPFAILMVFAIAWCVATFIWLAPRMLNEDWFEQALVTYGTLTGVAAVGLMLLRMADPHNRTTAAQAFAAGDFIDIKGPAVADATLAGIFFHILIVRG